MKRSKMHASYFVIDCRLHLEGFHIVDFQIRDPEVLHLVQSHQKGNWNRKMMVIQI